jgi:hypothetical protein
LNVFYCDYTAEELAEAIRFLTNNSSVGLVAIDYMQMLRQQNRKTAQRQEELKGICLMLKDFAVETGLPVLIGAQFNRTVVNESTMSPLAIGEAGDIERAANMIVGMWNRNYEGFTEEGNRGRDGKKKPKESAIYLEILKGRLRNFSEFNQFYTFPCRSGEPFWATQNPDDFCSKVISTSAEAVAENIQQGGDVYLSLSPGESYDMALLRSLTPSLTESGHRGILEETTIIPVAAAIPNIGLLHAIANATFSLLRKFFRWLADLLWC